MVALSSPMYSAASHGSAVVFAELEAAGLLTNLLFLVVVGRGMPWNETTETKLDMMITRLPTHTPHVFLFPSFLPTGTACCFQCGTRVIHVHIVNDKQVFFTKQKKRFR